MKFSKRTLPRPYTRAEDDYLRANWESYGTKRCADALNRREGSLSRRVLKLRLRPFRGLTAQASKRSRLDEAFPAPPFMPSPEPVITKPVQVPPPVIRSVLRPAEPEHSTLYSPKQLEALHVIGCAYTYKRVSWAVACELRELVKQDRIDEALAALQTVREVAA